LNVKKLGRYQVQVFDTSRRLSSHDCAGAFTKLSAAIKSAEAALEEHGIASVLIVDNEPNKDKT
jgi:hypothetical protein